MTGRTRRTKSDDGAMLLIALLIITVVALVTGALLTLSGGKFLATVSLRKVAANAYASDTAAKLAINDLVLGQNAGALASGATYPSGTPNGWAYDNNTDKSGCFGIASGGSALSQITMPSVYKDSQSGTTMSATVTCTPVAGSGIFGSGGGTTVIVPTTTDPFARALTTVGTANGSDGISLTNLSNTNPLPIRGSIASGSSINVSNGPLLASGTIQAVTNPCTTQGANASITPTCTYGAITTPSDPGSPVNGLVPTSAALPYRDPSTEGCNFLAGYYNNATALSSAVNLCATSYFASGVYYFDFTDGNPWTINTTLIGGQPTTSTTVPGSCLSPITNPTIAGVQFVFGNNSRVALGNSAQVELCGRANSGAAPITIYQQQNTVTASPTSVPSSGTAVAGTVTTVSTGKYDAFAPNPATSTLAVAVSAVGGVTANWKATKAANTGELDLQNFPGMSTIPNGSTITSAQLNVTYTKATTGTFTAGVSGQAGTTTVAATGTNTNVTAALQAQFSASSGANPFSTTNPKIQLMVGGGTSKNDTVNIDAVTLAVQYTTPPLRMATGTNTTAPPFISTGSNFAGRFVVQGSTYAPQGYITMGPGNACNNCGPALVAFRWGLLAWGVNFKAQPQQVFGYPLVSIPDKGFGLGSAVAAVDLKVFLCSGAGPCSTSDAPALTSRVQFTDYVCTAVSSSPSCPIVGELSPIPGQRQVNVISWAEQK